MYISFTATAYFVLVARVPVVLCWYVLPPGVAELIASVPEFICCSVLTADVAILTAGVPVGLCCNNNNNIIIIIIITASVCVTNLANKPFRGVTYFE